jgi:hypothetical protein
MNNEFQALPANAGEWEAEKIMYIFKALRQMTDFHSIDDIYNWVSGLEKEAGLE